MKLISFRRNGADGYGVVDGDGIIDMTPRMGGDYATLKDAIAGLALGDIEKAASGASTDFSLSDIEYEFPVAPEKIFCVGRNYRAYHEVLEDGGPKWPSIFPRFASSFSRHGEAILRPKESEQLDYEGEVGVIIGKGGRHIPEERALDHIAGYTVMNEGSVRDWQRRGTQNCPGKNFYHSGAIGPWMATTDEMPPLDKMTIVTRVDGGERQNGGTDMMIFSIPYVIAHLSKFTWLEPGDMIATGSPGGSAIENDPPNWLTPGQTIEIQIEPIGTLSNPIEAE